jgi:hypothetical protein
LIEEFRKAIASTFDRFRANIERAITDVALEKAIESRELAPQIDHAMAVFNSNADEIDRKFGKGWFGVRMVRDSAITYHRPAISWTT